MFTQPYVPSFLRIFFSQKIFKIRPYVPSFPNLSPNETLGLGLTLPTLGLGLGEMGIKSDAN